MVILKLALQKREFHGGPWLEGAVVAYNSGELEVCRELLYDSSVDLGIGTVKDEHDDFGTILKETKDQNVADILGMIIEELEAEGLDESDYEQLLKEFAEPLERWRNLETPKIKQNKGSSYGIIYDIIKKCYEHKAYHTALKLAGVLYVADRTKHFDYLSNTVYLVGKILYELGYMEVAKRCFEFVDEDTDGACWQDGDEKYKTLLERETALEVPKELIEEQHQMDEAVASGKLKLYTREELKEYRAGKRKIPVIAVKQQAKDRKKLGEKAIKLYEKSINANPEERLRAIDAAFAVFTEAPEVYPEAAYLYFQKGNIYLDSDFETAYDCFKRAYNCKDGKRNGLVLLGLAIVLSQMGRMKESTAYLFRTYILCGKDFVIDEVGEEPWKMVEAYL